MTPTAGANGLTLTMTRSIGTIPCAASSAICVGDVAAGEDARVDRVVERLDLAADRGLAGRQVRDRRDLDAVAGEVLAGAVGREDLDVEREQVAGERGDPVAIGD